MLRVQCYLLRAEDFGEWNRIWAEAFPAPRPVRTTIVTEFTVPGMLIEVEVTAGILVRVVVVGGGIAGLCCAYSLRKRDVDVTLVERARIGARTASSWGNGGWIAPAQAGPLPEPGLTVYGLRALLRADSALYFRPSYLPRLAPWLARFWTYCNQRDYDRGTAALAALGKSSFELTDRLAADGVEFDLWKLGMVCATEKPEDAQGPAEPGGHAGARLHAPGRHPRRGRDPPARAGAERPGQGRFHLHEQWNVKADTLVDGLGAKVRAMGVDVSKAPRRSSSTGATAASVGSHRPGDIAADQFVLAAGSWTTPADGRSAS